MYETKLAIALCSLLLAAPGLADDKNSFIVPSAPGPAKVYSANPVWEVGTVQKIEWLTDHKSYDLTLWQQNAAGGAGKITTIYTAQGDGNGTQSIQWPVQIYPSSNAYPVYYFWLIDSDNESIVSSQYFNMTIKASSSSSTATPTPTSLATTTSAPTATASQVNTDEATVTPAAKKSTSKVGLGAGLGVGIPVVLAVVGAIWFFLRKKRSNSENGKLDPESDYGRTYVQEENKAGLLEGREIYEAPVRGPMSELPATQESPVELPTHNR